MMGMGTRIKRDDGMTLLEVVVAAAILFIIMTALLGLLGRTMQMGAQAKEINVSNNAVNSYVEWVRSLPFDEIDDSGGSIEATSIVSGDYTIIIEPSVSDGENEALKNLSLTITVSRPDGFTETFETSAVIHDRDQHLTDAARSPSTDPRVEFISPTPPDGTVVWYASGGSWWRDAGGTTRPVQVQARVQATSGRTLELVAIQGQESWLLEDAFGNLATWTNPAWTITPTFSWDVNQRTDLNEVQVEEGKNDVWVYATDSAGARSSDMRVYLLDNVAPGKPSSISFVPSGQFGTIQWPVTQDGNQYSDHYHVRVLRHDVYGTWDNPGWPVALDADAGTNSIASPTGNFCRYVAQVQAVSPRGLTLGYTDYISFVTRPKVTGTYTLSGSNKKWDVTSISITCPEPAFPITGTTTYQWYTVNGTTETAIAGATSRTLTRAKDTVTNYPDTPLLGYRCKVTCTPNGMYAPARTTYVSNTVFPDMPAGTSKAFAEGTW